MRQDTAEAAGAPGQAFASRARWQLEGSWCSILAVLARSRTRGRRNAANEPVLAEGKRVLIDHEQRFDRSRRRSAELVARLPAPWPSSIGSHLAQADPSPRRGMSD